MLHLIHNITNIRKERKVGTALFWFITLRVVVLSLRVKNSRNVGKELPLFAA